MCFRHLALLGIYILVQLTTILCFSFLKYLTTSFNINLMVSPLNAIALGGIIILNTNGSLRVCIPNEQFYFWLGNSNLVYTIIRKRNVFHSLANLPTDHSTIQKSLSKRNKLVPSTSTISLNSCVTAGVNSQSMEGSTPAKPAEKGTLNASLAPIPCKHYIVI